jgi:microcystin-dependent protein
MIFPWPLNWAPVDFLFCQGQTLAINQYQALYSLIGTTYGGNGTSNFMLPNLQGVFPIGTKLAGPGQTYALGATGGSLTTTLTQQQMPVHTHTATFTPTGGGTPTVTVTMQGSSAAGSVSSPTGNYLAGSVPTTPQSKNLYVPAASAPGTLGNLAGASASIAGGITGGTVTNAVAGAGQPVTITPPYLSLNYIICVNGIYPTRP